MSKSLQKLARNLFGGKSWTVQERWPIFDAAGPEIFRDTILADPSGSVCWIRTLSGSDDLIVSVQQGPHPISTIGEDVFRSIPRYFSTGAPKLSSFGSYIDKIEAVRNKYNFFARIAKTITSSSLVPPIYCYHYPELAILTKNAAGEDIFVDISDGRSFKLSESGSQTTETRTPYSFLSEYSESGDPGPIQVPSDDLDLTGQLIGQERDNWCTAASCEMILAFHGIATTQADIAAIMNIPENPALGGASGTSQLTAFEHFGADLFHARLNDAPLGQECVNELSSGRPVKIGIFGHAQACFGWKQMDGTILYRIYDPLPVGKGALKLQNPNIIWSRNHITFQPK